MLTIQDKKDIGEIVKNTVDGAIDELVKDFIVPGFELVYQTMSTKKDLKAVESRLEDRLETMETRLDSVERKLDRVIDNQLEDQGELKNHDKRINKLELAIAIS